MGEPEDIQFIDIDATRALRYSELFLVGLEWIDVLNSIGLSEAPPELDGKVKVVTDDLHNVYNLA